MKVFSTKIDGEFIQRSHIGYSFEDKIQSMIKLRITGFYVASWMALLLVLDRPCRPQ